MKHYFGFSQSGFPLVDLGKHETFDQADEASNNLQKQGIPILWIDTHENWNKFLLNSLLVLFPEKELTIKQLKKPK